MMSLDRATLARAGAVAILALLLLVLWIGPIGTYVDLVGEGAEEIAQKAAVLQRYRALADAGPADRTGSDRTGSARTDPAPTDPALLIPAMPDAQAVALLQETVKSAAAAAQVQIQGLQVLRSEGEAGVQKIAVRIRALGDVGGLVRLLYALETARPLLYPDNLQIQAQAAAPGSPPSALQFQLDVAGFKAGAPS
jgi:general secretion pathway protein M